MSGMILRLMAAVDLHAEKKCHVVLFLFSFLCLPIIFLTKLYCVGIVSED